MAHLVTGMAGYAHVKSEDEAKINMAVYGNTEAVLSYGNNLSISVPSSNKVQVMDGLIYMQGRWIDVPAPEELILDNGIAGTNRNDLIIVRYKKDAETGIESAELAVKKGDARADALDPELTIGDIEDGALINEMALYRIPFSEINIGEPEKIFRVMHIRAEVDEKGNNIVETYARNDSVLHIVSFDPATGTLNTRSKP